MAGAPWSVVNSMVKISQAWSPIQPRADICSASLEGSLASINCPSSRAPSPGQPSSPIGSVVAVEPRVVVVVLEAAEVVVVELGPVGAPEQELATSQIAKRAAERIFIWC